MPLLGHGRGRRVGKGSDGSEDDEAESETGKGVEGDLLALIRGRKSTGAVGSESDPVGCISSHQYGDLRYPIDFAGL